MTTFSKQDYDQEFALALLEGCDDDTAVKRARKAGEQRERIGGRWVKHHSVHDWSVEQMPDDSFTLDYRSDREVEEGFERWERARDEMERCLGFLTDAQRAVVELRYGFATGRRETYASIAATLGYSKPQHAHNVEQRALARIQRKLAEPSRRVRDEARLARKREMNRLWMARRRAQQRAVAA